MAAFYDKWLTTWPLSDTYGAPLHSNDGEQEEEKLKIGCCRVKCRHSDEIENWSLSSHFKDDESNDDAMRVIMKPKKDDDTNWKREILIENGGWRP